MSPSSTLGMTPALRTYVLVYSGPFGRIARDLRVCVAVMKLQTLYIKLYKHQNVLP